MILLVSKIYITYLGFLLCNSLGTSRFNNSSVFKAKKKRINDYAFCLRLFYVRIRIMYDGCQFLIPYMKMWHLPPFNTYWRGIILYTFCTWLDILIYFIWRKLKLQVTVWFKQNHIRQAVKMDTLGEMSRKANKYNLSKQQQQQAQQCIYTVKKKREM